MLSFFKTILILLPHIIKQFPMSIAIWSGKIIEDITATRDALWLERACNQSKGMVEAFGFQIQDWNGAFAAKEFGPLFPAQQQLQGLIQFNGDERAPGQFGCDFEIVPMYAFVLHNRRDVFRMDRRQNSYAGGQKFNFGLVLNLARECFMT